MDRVTTVARSSLRDHAPLGASDHAAVNIELSPFPTVGLLTFDAVQPRVHLGTPAAYCREILARLRRQDLDVLRLFKCAAAPRQLVGSMVAPPMGFASLLCGAPGRGPRFEDCLEQVAATSPEAFLRASQSCASQAPADARALLRSDPRRWLQRYAMALQRAWEVIEPLWRRSRPLLDYEVERVRAASARGSSADLVAALHPAVEIIDGTRTPAGLISPAHRVAPRLTVSPMVTGSRATAVFGDGSGRIGSLFYPANDAWRAFERQLPPPASLQALIGQSRATILQRLDRPVTARRIAELLSMVPSAAGRHLRSLEAAGLVSRTRCDGKVVVERTARGTALVALHDDV